ncbi:MAG: hypothetical protein R3B84_15185 [Zavarzinella sp.]
MNTIWTLFKRIAPQNDQQSFIGGKPFLPTGTNLPTCKLCGQREAFMFQVAFPPQANWGGRTISCFACMRCADESFLIPEMLEEHWQGCDIPNGFLQSYQRNFTFLVFPTNDAKIVENYEEQVAFVALELQSGLANGGFGKIGGTPNWVLDDETPATYSSKIPMIFILELSPGIQFPKVQGALPQTELDIFGSPSTSPLDYYQLFLGNATFLFGTSSGDPLVYAITQV